MSAEMLAEVDGRRREVEDAQLLERVSHKTNAGVWKSTTGNEEEEKNNMWLSTRRCSISRKA